MPPEASPSAQIRLTSLDAFRGFVMLLMMAEVIRLSAVSMALPGNAFWAFLAHHQTHVEWTGCSLHDLIQPSFSFIVGVALPFSIAARLARGQTRGWMTLHAFSRALILILLGIFLRSVGKPQTYFTFEDTLSQIGLGYGFLFMLGFRSVRDQWIAFALLLAGYWLAFALYPLPAAGFDYSQVGVPPDWMAQHGLGGLAARWNKNSNLAWAFDTRFLNLFPREKPFVFNVGGYATLSFIPTLATMILGLLAGETLRREATPSQKLRWLVCAGFIGLAAGWLLGALGICPVVKRIWTPSWTLFSGGWCCLLMAAFYFLVDIRNRRAWAFPLIVIGLNSIAAYCMAHLFENFIRAAFLTHLGENTFRILGKPYEPLLLGAFTLLLLWLILFWMQRRKIFLRI
jgi:heparan-alpha-glucosaminide N-acetyltransferase